MLASSDNTVSELRWRDAGWEHAHPSGEPNSSPLLAQRASSSDAHSSCSAPHSPGGMIDDYARIFECNICMQLCEDPVATMCGHLFCWPCLYSCLSLQSACKACPVCKADVQDKIVPLYGCGRVGSVAENFHGIRIPCRPSVKTNHSACACAQRERHHARQEIPGGLLGRCREGAALLVMRRRRRFSNEKRFVLHWLFILLALPTIAFFLSASC